MKTIKDFLTETFGESAARIRDDHGYVGALPYTSVHLVIRDDGRTFVLCGGECLMAFPAVHGKGMQGTAYLVRDDADGQRWESRRFVLATKMAIRLEELDPETRRFKRYVYPDMTPADWTEWHSSRPSAQLKLVLSV